MLNFIKNLLFIFLSLDVCDAWDPRLYPYDPRIHNFGNHGTLGSVHSLIAPLFTLYTDTTIYGRNLRKKSLTRRAQTRPYWTSDAELDSLRRLPTAAKAWM